MIKNEFTMFLRASDYPAIFRRKEVFERCFIFDLILTFNLVEFGVKPFQNTFAEQYAVMVCLKSYIVNTTIIDWEYLPVRFDLHFQFSSS